MTDNKVIIGSRESKLAVLQSEMVRDYIISHNEHLQVEILTMKTTGDIILDRTLDKIGGKGLFVKELDRALLDHRSDLSVHSLKDMPMEVPKELPLIAFSKREDPRDVLVLPEGMNELDQSKPIGCSSARRILQLAEIYPQMEVKSIRGNLQTRLRKLDSGEYSALILAAAGLKRLGLEHRISRYFTVDEMIPAAGQGILAVQGRTDIDDAFIRGYDDQDAHACAVAERAFVAYLDGGCSAPIAAFAQIDTEKNTDVKRMTLRGLYYDDEMKKVFKGKKSGSPADAKILGEQLAKELKEKAMMKKGKVWLVGAGPGDLGLFTIKGLEVLQHADVVVYDSLVGQSILAQIPETAKLIYVGKRANHHTMVQEEINQVLVDEAKKGYRVVRLKGGDPFLFGRGGEELELLTKNEIAYEVVPGVTSSLAVPAYNGIPVTHRDYCSSVHIITGHKRAGQSYDIDFSALVNTKGTLVFMMGVSSLPDIMKGLLDAGMTPDMPAAILQKGTTADQKRIVATISTLEQKVLEVGIETPAIIIVGKVCKLSEDFEWYEKLPLAGWKVLVTRPKKLISQTSAILRQKGAEVIELPAIHTEPLADQTLLQNALISISDYTWLVFTSPTGVEVFFDQLFAEKKDIRVLGQIKIASIGQGTAKKLADFGLYPDFIPSVYDGDHLGEELAKMTGASDHILIPRAMIGNQKLVEYLTQSGAKVDDVPTYQTLYVKSEVFDEKAAFDREEIDCVIFTSASTVKGFVEATEGIDYTKVTAACIGKQTKAAADQYQMKTYMSEKATIESLIELVVKLKGMEA